MQTQSHLQEQQQLITFMESTKLETTPKKWNPNLMKMKLVAEILTGTLFYVEVEEDATVGDLKKEIGKQENLPSDRLILLLDAEERYALDKDEAALKDYGVEDSSHIYIFFQPQDPIIASSASLLTLKNPASSEPSHSVNSANEPSNTDEKDEADDNKPPHEDNDSNEADEASASVDQEECVLDN